MKKNKSLLTLAFAGISLGTLTSCDFDKIDELFNNLAEISKTKTSDYTYTDIKLVSPDAPKNLTDEELVSIGYTVYSFRYINFTYPDETQDVTPYYISYTGNVTVRDYDTTEYLESKNRVVAKEKVYNCGDENFVAYTRTDVSGLGLFNYTGLTTSFILGNKSTQFEFKTYRSIFEDNSDLGLQYYGIKSLYTQETRKNSFVGIRDEYNYEEIEDNYSKYQYSMLCGYTVKNLFREEICNLTIDYCTLHRGVTKEETRLYFS